MSQTKHTRCRDQGAGLRVAAAALLAISASPQQALADCDLDAFLDTKTEGDMFLNAAKCSADKALESGTGSLKQAAVDIASSGLNMITPGLGTILSGIAGGDSNKDQFGPYAAEILNAVGADTNKVISDVDSNFSGDDLTALQSLEQTYAKYEANPYFYSRVQGASTESGLTQKWFQTLDRLTLPRNGAPALHAYVSFAVVMARRFADLELALMVAGAAGGTPYQTFIANATEDDMNKWVADAQAVTASDNQVLWGEAGGTLDSNAVPGVFSYIKELANGGFRDYSDGRFSTVSLGSGHMTACGGNISITDRMTGTYQFPIPADQTNTVTSPATTYTITQQYDLCGGPDSNGKYTWTFNLTDPQGATVYTGSFYAGLPSSLGTDPFSTAMSQLKQAAYEKFLTQSYGAVRPILDQWWQAIGNAGYSAYTGDSDLNQLVQSSETVQLAMFWLIESASDWESMSSADERQLVNYVLTYGANGLDELRNAAEMDVLAWQSGTVRADDYRKFLSSNADPQGAAAYFTDQMVAKLVAASIL